MICDYRRKDRILIFFVLSDLLEVIGNASRGISIMHIDWTIFTTAATGTVKSGLKSFGSKKTELQKSFIVYVLTIVSIVNSHKNSS